MASSHPRHNENSSDFCKRRAEIVIFLKSGLGAKIALGALGVVLGVGGITAGAKWHAANNAHLGNQRLYIGRIVSLTGNAMSVHTASGATITVMLLPRTIIRQRGKTVTAAVLHVGDHLLVHVFHTKTGTIYALSIAILKAAPTAQAP